MEDMLPVDFQGPKMEFALPPPGVDTLANPLSVPTPTAVAGYLSHALELEYYYTRPEGSEMNKWHFQAKRRRHIHPMPDPEKREQEAANATSRPYPRRKKVSIEKPQTPVSLLDEDIEML